MTVHILQHTLFVTFFMLLIFDEISLSPTVHFVNHLLNQGNKFLFYTVHGIYSTPKSES